MRHPAVLLAFASTLAASTLAACGGGDLTLPGPGEPADLKIVSGDGQQGQPGAVVPDPLIVQLVDGVGQPISGRTVEFRFLSAPAGAMVDPGQASTDDSGQVAARVRLGEEPGNQSLEAVVTTPGQDLRVQFGLRAKAPATGGGGGASPSPVPADDGTPQGGENDDGGGGNGGGGGGTGGDGNGGGGQGGGGGGDDHGGDGGGHGHGHGGGNDHGNGHDD